MEEQSYDNHKDDCLDVNKVKIDMPQKLNNVLKFLDHDKSYNLDFLMFSDIESMSHEDDNYLIKNAVCRHEPYSISAYLHCSDEKFRANEGKMLFMIG